MAAAPIDPFGLEGSVLDGRYEVHSFVARGGFGVVYRGRDIGLDDAVAIKVLNLPTSLGAEERSILFDIFRQEARTTAQLKHPAIVRATGFGVSRMPDGRELPWMAMEWIQGKTLAEELQTRGRPMGPAEALAVLRPVIDALAYAHERSIAHRDVKPANILIEKSAHGSARGMVGARLLDFGIAKALEPGEHTVSGETRTVGHFAAFSLPYAAPEQKTALKTGPWTDVHAIGLILTEMLTGSAPYAGKDRIEVEGRVLSPERPTPARFGIDVGAWEPVLARAVSLRHPERYQSAGEFLDALEHALPAACHLPRNLPGATEPAWGTTTRPPEAPRPPSTPPPAPDTLSAATGGVPAAAAPAGRRTWPLALAAVAVVSLAVVAGQALRSMRTSSAPTAPVVAAVRPTPTPAAPPAAPPAVPVGVPPPSTTPPTPHPPAIVERTAPAPSTQARASAASERPRAPRARRRGNEGRRAAESGDGFEGM